MLPVKAQEAGTAVALRHRISRQREDGAVLLRQRAEAGLLGGMLEVPSTPWRDALPAKKEALRSAPVTTAWLPVAGTVVHVFTHFRLELIVYRALVPVDASFTLWAEQERCRWVDRRDLHAQALPSLMKKVIAHGAENRFSIKHVIAALQAAIQGDAAAYIALALNCRVKPGRGVGKVLFRGFEHDRPAEPELTFGFGA